MIKIRKLDNRISPNGLRLARLGDVINLNNGDIVGIARHMDTEHCSDLCYFADTDGISNFCKGAYIVKREVPNSELYIRPTKFKNCFLKAGLHFVKIGSKKEGI